MSGRIRGAWATLTFVALATLAGCQSSPSSTRTPLLPSTPTATPLLSAWTAITDTTAARLAPVGVRTEYTMRQATNAGAPQFQAFQRSDDAGLTWSNVTWPRIAGVSLPADVTGTQFYWNPYAPRTIFLWLQLMNDAQCPSIDQVPIPVINGIARATSTTGELCQITSVSNDGGATWRAVTAPLTGGFGGIGLTGAPPSAGSVAAQGSRLYALFLPSVQANGFHWRLAASDDGGATWRLIDSPIAAAGQEVTDYTATPSGSALFALTQPAQFNAAGPSGMSLPPVQFWSSLDGGATWTRGATPPGQRMDGLAVAQDTSTGATIAYALSDSENDTDLHLYASLDGGRSWGHTVDLQTREQDANSLHLLTPLSNGAIALFGYPGDATYSPQGGPVSVWRYDWSAAPVLTQPSNIDLVNQVASQPSPSGGIRLWLAGLSGSGPNLLEYVDLKY